MSQTGPTITPATSPAPERIRLDKWLWQARFFKSRRLAGEAASSGTVRVNGARIAKAAHAVRPGDVLTFPQGRTIRVVRVLDPGTRRGPASEARTLYEDLAPIAPDTGAPDSGPAASDAPQMPAQRARGAGRPTKRERRGIEALRRHVPPGSS